MRDIRVSVNGTLIELWHRASDPSGNNDTHNPITYLQFEEALELSKLLPAAVEMANKVRLAKLTENKEKLIAERTVLQNRIDAIDNKLSGV